MPLCFGRFIKRSLATLSSNHPKVCIIGSGPAGFYTASKILKSHPSVHIDIYEKLPIPFGLVRYGVAPDHPDVKNCINSFTQAANNNRVSFIGNVAVGRDVSLSQLKNAYNAIVLAYGAQVDRKLNIGGEFLPNVISARRFVGWYNGLPADSAINVNLDTDEAVIIGQGNVALDVARILLTPLDMLEKTDIPEAVLEQLRKSRVKKVTIIGRRKVEHVSFTVKELREMINLQGCRPIFHIQDFNALRNMLTDVPRKRKRLMELLVNAVFQPTQSQIENWAKASNSWQLKFQCSPIEIVSNSDGTCVEGIQLAETRVEDGVATATDKTEFFPCNLVIKSIGYTSLRIDPNIPFDEKKGIIPNEWGRVNGEKGLYVCGWLGTGAVGVIAHTMTNGKEVGSTIVSDLESEMGAAIKCGKEEILSILEKKGILSVSFDEWSKLNEHELSEGTKLGKPREKITDVNKMLNIFKNDIS